MRELLTIIKALGMGAGLMYVLDPESGAKRRGTLRRQALEVAVAAGDEADRLLVAAGHKLAEQTCHIRDQVMHAVTGNGVHHDGADSTVADIASSEPAVEPVSAASCPMANSRLLTGIGGSVLVAYGLRSRSPLALVATALGVALVAKAILHEEQALSPDAAGGAARPSAPQDLATESRWHVAQP